MTIVSLLKTAQEKGCTVGVHMKSGAHQAGYTVKGVTEKMAIFKMGECKSGTNYYTLIGEIETIESDVELI